jgi:hypothetical protein
MKPETAYHQKSLLNQTKQRKPLIFQQKAASRETAFVV